jgi:hypothetical protein
MGLTFSISYANLLALLKNGEEPMTNPITNESTGSIVFDKCENLIKMGEEITYVKKLEAFVHKEILPKIGRFLEKESIDQISRHDLEGYRESIFTCIATLDCIIERYDKDTDHVNLLLDLISRGNQTFTDVLYNGTARGSNVRVDVRRLVFDEYDLGPEVCIENVAATTYSWGRMP